MSVRRFRIVVCRGPECGDKRDSQAVHAAFADALSVDPQLAARCELDWQCCFGRCTQGPNVLVREVFATAPPRTGAGLADLPARLGGGPRSATALYNRVAPVNVPDIVASHLAQGVVVRQLVEPIGGVPRSSETTVAADPAARPDPLASRGRT